MTPILYVNQYYLQEKVHDTMNDHKDLNVK